MQVIIVSLTLWMRLSSRALATAEMRLLVDRKREHIIKRPTDRAAASFVYFILFPSAVSHKFYHFANIVGISFGCLFAHYSSASFKWNNSPSSQSNERHGQRWKQRKNQLAFKFCLRFMFFDYIVCHLPY